MREYQTFAEFFPFYLRQHARPRTRFFHIAGVGLTVLTFLTVLVLDLPWLLLAAPLAGYGPAWISHAFIERNKPATLTYPLWSLRGDIWMSVLWVSGRLDAELERAGVGPSLSSP
ncbi:hypothetical protein PB2503_01852 [Parvularcula bermudensis HTCC2503]|uniref:DUF962 domain-containing protein n=1 Tax=Parvularcula bermudensis (strain ATCC BAA-594 / HTCC2503 / KCTC 12087) TaxID=314260 RepID=E0TBV6_PARBH|nr:DUF962 domain-containing protein [Parvularcula bermudensis]ADM08449.1 hypothetical protein PB2503_01852 [Parvularcula bermudensis HTCC2503]